MSVINEYVYFLDSKYRTNGGNPNPEFILGDTIILENPNNYFIAKLVSCDIPYSFKNLASPNNKVNIRVQVIDDSIDFTTTLTITEGNYNILSLLQELKNKLDIIVSGLTHLPAFIFTYDKATSKCTLLMTVNGSHDTIITLKWTTADILAEYFGFSYLVDTILHYHGGIDTSTDNISPFNVDVSPITSIYIRSSTLSQQSNNAEFLVEPVESISDIICKVPINSQAGTWIVYENAIDFKVRLNVKSIDRISFYLTNGLSYDVINLNNVHWKCCLQIQEIETSITTQMRAIEQDKKNKVAELENTKKELIDELIRMNNELQNEKKNK
jgi:hypothetical protein